MTEIQTGQASTLTILNFQQLALFKWKTVSMTDSSAL
jgi:hypothetical protein